MNANFTRLAAIIVAVINSYNPSRPDIIQTALRRLGIN
jgi:hypothetical protein